MARTHRIFNSRRLIVLLSLLLVAGFFATTLSSYYVSKQAILDAIIGRELPLTSNNIYTQIQKDLVQPVLISSTMANDTFLRSWVIKGEKNPNEIAHYLEEVKKRYGAFSSFFVSDRSSNYYTGGGVLKHISSREPRDIWYYRVRDMKEPYEINVDPDLANKDTLTIFVNYRVFDFENRYIGATGIGLTVDAVRRLITDYQQRYKRTIYFTNTEGKMVLFSDQSGRKESNLRATQGLNKILDRILLEKHGSYQYVAADGSVNLVNVSFIPELKWYLFVERSEEEALAGIRQTLYFNLVICLAVTLIVLILTHIALNRYQRRIEEMASTDKLTGLFNRQAFSILIDRRLAEYRRNPHPFSMLLADIDQFKSINDQNGHLCGDQILNQVAQLFRDCLRDSDIVVRWGGEEFLVILKDCGLEKAQQTAEKLRQDFEKAHFEGCGKQIKVTMSIGVSQYDEAETIEQTISRADAGLYQAKKGGRNRVCTATST
ncbi:MAG: sensor domain-containing diguanylate cyclase [Betaproteobacteria bacterium]|nr:sensor domain-containing diguanylate cyclase [Betaproteobacteria bacterium]